jgi:two-component system, LytTR family, response regulator
LYCTDVEVIGEADSVKSGIETITKLQPDLVLLDVDLGDGTGFDLLKKMEPANFKVVFITAYQEHATKAFKFSAIDYILKPVNSGELTEAISRAKVVQKENLEDKLKAFMDNIGSIAHEAKKIVLKTTESIHIVNVQDIVRCESDRNYTYFYFRDAKKLLVSRTLGDYEEMLGAYKFYRPHQSHLVNLNFIEKFEKADGGFLILKDKTKVPVSTRKREHLMNLLEQL